LINGDIGLDWALIEKNRLQLGTENRILLGDDSSLNTHDKPGMLQVREITEDGPFKEDPGHNGDMRNYKWTYVTKLDFHEDSLW
jgi:hypothetical protein